MLLVRCVCGLIRGIWIFGIVGSVGFLRGVVDREAVFPPMGSKFFGDGLGVVYLVSLLIALTLEKS